MIELRHNTGGGSEPAYGTGGLHGAVIPAVLDGSAGAGPLSHDAAGIVGVVAVDHTIVYTVPDRPVAAGGVVLVSDDTACETVGIAALDLTAHKGSVDQIAQVLLGLVHTDDAAGTYADSFGFIVQEPVTGYTVLQASGNTVVSGDSAQIAVAVHLDLETTAGHGGGSPYTIIT